MFDEVFASLLKLPLLFAEGDGTQAGGGQGEGATGAAGGEGDGGQGATGADATGAAAAEGDGAQGAAKTDWRDKELARKHRQIKERDDEIARLRTLEDENKRLRELAEAGTRGKDGQQQQRQQDDRPAAEETRRPAATDPSIMREAEFNVQLRSLTERLQGEHAADWTAAAANFEKVGGIPPQVMEGILATDDPAFVTIALGKDPAKFQEILDLPFARQLNALNKLALTKLAPDAGKKPTPKPSGAPAPVQHVRQTSEAAPAGSVNLYDDKTEDDRWYAERMRQKRESNGRPWSVGRTAGR